MDPAETCESIYQRAEDCLWYEAWESLEDLGQWLRRGGYPPEGYADLCDLAMRAHAVGYPVNGLKNKHKRILCAVKEA